MLHHLHSPRKAIQLFYDILKPGGIYIGEEGIISAAFAYSTSFAWQGYEPHLKAPNEEIDGVDRDGDFGIKLFYCTKQAGFKIDNCQIVQPLLWKKAQKKLLLNNLNEFKKTALSQGMTVAEWDSKFQETQRLIKDEDQLIAFYASCQIAAIK